MYLNKIIFSLLILTSGTLLFAREPHGKILDHKILQGSTASFSDKLKNKQLDKAALDYCLNHENTYIAIIWPRAVDHLEGMKEILATCGTLLYEKSFELIQDAPIWLYETAHPGFHPEKLKKHIKNYIPADMYAPYQFYAILFETDKCLADIVLTKQKIRDYVGISYWSIHIDDFHYESTTLGRLVFDKKELKSINKTPYREDDTYTPYWAFAKA